MIRPFLPPAMRQVLDLTRPFPVCCHPERARRAEGLAFSRLSGRRASRCASAIAALLAVCPFAPSQVITIDTKAKTPVALTGPVDRRYAQIEPTRVPLSNSELNAKTRIELIRLLQSEQGFAMRPFPRGHKGLTLTANGNLNPAGEEYLNMVISSGLSAKPGDRVVISDVKIEHTRIVFELNGGPDLKHRFLRHIQIGVGSTDAVNPVVRDAGQEPQGARLTLAFADHVPELTGPQVKALLAPLISFDVKTPIQAFTDTLPAKLKDAILNHQVLVGMSTDMVLFAKGQPQSKTREVEGQTPFEEWIYGKPPQPVEFVRINGNRVIRLEVARVGKPPVILTEDVVGGMWRTDGTPLSPELSKTRTVEMGDAQRDTDRQAPAAPPSLRKPGETLPTDKDAGVMKPVQFPKPRQPGTNPDEQPDSTPSTPAPSQSPAPSAPPPAVPQPK